MAIIPEYRANVQLNSERGTMPRPNFDDALGTALKGLGSSIGSLAAQMQTRREQREDFNTEIEWRKYQQTLATGMDDAKQNMAADGAGFHDGFMGEVYKPARDKFLSTVPERLRPKYEKLLETAGLDETDWSTKAAVGERDQLYSWSNENLKTMTNQMLTNLSQDPEQYDTLLQSGMDLIDKSPQPEAAKDEWRRNWERMAQLAYLATKVQSDPEGVLKELHADTRTMSPTTQFSLLSSVVETIESGGDPSQVSGKGAAGRMQVMPGTARDIARELRDDNFDPKWSDAEVQQYLKNPDVGKRYGNHYLMQQIRTFAKVGGLDAALVAYNAGPEVAKKWIASGFDKSVLPGETRAYLDKAHARMPAIGELSGRGSGDPKAVRLEFHSRRGRAENSDGRPSSDIQPELAQRVQASFAALGIDRVRINSGYRSVETNRAVKGAKNSQHIHGNAIDIDVTGYSYAERVRIINALSANGIGGLGVGTNIIHADIGPRRAWGYAKASGGGPVPKWAEAAIAEHLAGRASVKPGEAPVGAAGRFATLPFSDRMNTIGQAENELTRKLSDLSKADTASKYALRETLANELASIRATGEATGRVQENDIASVLGEDGYAKFLDDRREAQQHYAAVNGVARMSDDDMDARLSLLSPDPGSETYAADQRAFAAAEKEVSRVRNLRATRPAEAAMEYPDVRQAYDAFRADPSAGAAQEFVRLTLERQREFGATPQTQQPLPRREALSIGRAFSSIPEVAKKASDVRAMVLEQYLSLKEVFGPYTEEVIIAAMQSYKGMSKQDADIVVGYMEAVERGGDPFHLKAKQDTEADISQGEGFGFFDWAKRFWNGGDAPADPNSDAPKPLTSEERLRLSDTLDGATPEMEADIVKMYGEAAVEAAKRASKGQ